MSKKQFQANIRQIDSKVNAYVNIAVKTTHACIILHEHLGLVENVVQVTQFLLGPRVSIVIPDLFLSTTSKSLLNNEFDAIKKLKISRVIQSVESCINFIEKSHSKIMLIGYSIGSAYAFKVLQKLSQKFECSFLFYGLPNLVNFSSQKIRSKVVSFFGTDDKIKYLSDFQTYQQFIKACKGNTNIKFEQINGVGHGFLNADSNDFSQKAVLYCQKIIFTYLPQSLITHRDAGKIEESKNKDEKQKCLLF